MNEVDKLYTKYDILPSVVKDSRINKDVFYKTYKQAFDFRNKLHDFDKKRSYKSEASKRLDL